MDLLHYILFTYDVCMYCMYVCIYIFIRSPIFFFFAYMYVLPAPLPVSREGGRAYGGGYGPAVRDGAAVPPAVVVDACEAGDFVEPLRPPGAGGDVCGGRL